MEIKEFSAILLPLFIVALLYSFFGFWIIPAAAVLAVYSLLKIYLPPIVASLSYHPTVIMIANKISGVVLTTASIALLYAYFTAMLSPLVFFALTTFLSVLTIQTVYNQYISEVELPESFKYNYSPWQISTMQNKIKDDSEDFAVTSSLGIVIVASFNYVFFLLFGLGVQTLALLICDATIWLQAAIGLSNFTQKNPSRLFQAGALLILSSKLPIILTGAFLLATLPFGSGILYSAHLVLLQAFTQIVIPACQISMIAGTTILQARKLTSLKPARVEPSVQCCQDYHTKLFPNKPHVIS
ncbi:hypothetical protein OAT84_01100 [Gammaproteobacteria bacterium]|nr:hypothetical protein [Gammaproteobacteria bacterium]